MKFYPWIEQINGLQLPNSPKFQASLVVDMHPSAWRRCADARVAYSYQGSQYGQI